MAYGARLESVLGASPRGFESPILRDVMSRVIVPMMARDFCCVGRSGSGSPISTLSRVWVADIERHEAFLNLAVMKGHRSASVAAVA